MKKTVIVLAMMIFAGSIATSQDLVSKKGFPILPVKGDYSIGFDAVPVLDFALNTVNIMVNTGQTAGHPGFVSGFHNVIVGKYFLEDNQALRMKFGINNEMINEATFFKNPKDFFNNPGDPEKWGEIKDVRIFKTLNILLGIGIEKRRGHNRLQGFYGGEVLLGLNSISVIQHFAVKMNQEAIDNGYQNGNGSLVSAPRNLKVTSGYAPSLALRAFAGVEYFVAPKISIGGEFGWGAGIVMAPRGKVKTESWNSTDKKAEIKTDKGNKKDTTFSLSVDNGISAGLGASASLSIFFHF